MIMRKFLLCAALLFLLPASLSAHEVKSSGTLNILLHMEPLDNPAAGEDAQLYFSVEDTAGKFKYADCTCRVIVKSSDNKELLNRLVTPADDAPDWGVNVSRIEFVFPQIGIYKVSIQGTSTQNTFAPFNLEYDKRIERQSENETLSKVDENEDSGWFTDYYLIGGLVIVFGIIIHEVSNRLRKKNK
jgi:hypothetical protein